MGFFPLTSVAAGLSSKSGVIHFSQLSSCASLFFTKQFLSLQDKLLATYLLCQMAAMISLAKSQSQ